MEYKICQSEIKEADQKDLSVVHFISTERPDRGGDILYADGMVVQGKPVVLFQHGQGSSGMEPVAKNLWLKTGEFKKNKGIMAKTEFYPDELGRRLWKKTTQSYMPNWSVGWIPIEQEFRTDKTGKQIRHVTSWSLLEYSLVSVPMQPDAQTLSFKIMPISEKRGLLDVGQPYLSGGKLSIWIPDEIIDGIKETVHKEFNRIRGKVE